MPGTRRHFLQVAGSAGPAAAAQERRTRANDRIRIATIGIGGMRTGDTHSARAQAGVELVAVADVYQGRLTRAREVFGSQVFTTRDYREVLARKDIDAAERRTGRILQVGSQRVSSVIYQKAQELLAVGAIGTLNMVEAWWDRNSAQGAWQYSIPPDATPANIDWDRFLGRAPKVPFEPVRLFRWRNYRDCGTGVAGDLFVHLFSGMHFITGTIGPTRVYATGGLRFWKDGRDVPDVMLGLYDYAATARHPAFNLALRVNFVDGAGESPGFRFLGSEGIMTVDGGVSLSKQPRATEPGYNIETFPKAVQEEFLREYRRKYPRAAATADAMRPVGEERYRAPRGYSDHLDHHRNFFQAVRSRKPVVEDAAFGLRAAGPALLSNVSYFEQRPCRWDPQNMVLQG